jgi:hypothetical protein
MKTKAYPIVAFKPDTYEIDEFDCASIFLLVGDQRAMVIDAGGGTGHLKGAIEAITDKPLIHVATHGHMDHIGNSWQFGAVHLNERDWGDHMHGYQDNLESRRKYANMIAHRQRGENPDYPYDPDTDITPWGTPAERLPLVDGRPSTWGDDHHRLCLPGHTPGQMMLLDEKRAPCLSAMRSMPTSCFSANRGIPDSPALKLPRKGWSRWLPSPAVTMTSSTAIMTIVHSAGHCPTTCFPTQLRCAISCWKATSRLRMKRIQ